MSIINFNLGYIIYKSLKDVGGVSLRIAKDSFWLNISFMNNS